MTIPSTSVKQTLRRCAFVSAFIMVTLFETSASKASEFIRVCNESKEHADALINECKSKARPFSRQFFPGGSGAPVQEVFSAWFNIKNDKTNFGFGCVIGPSHEIRFFGIYFAIDPSNFELAN